MLRQPLRWVPLWNSELVELIPAPDLFLGSHSAKVESSSRPVIRCETGPWLLCPLNSTHSPLSPLTTLRLAVFSPAALAFSFILEPGQHTPF